MTTTQLGTMASGKFVGAHVSIAGGFSLAVENISALGANAFAIFLGSQRMWNAPPPSEAECERFKRAMKFHSISSDMVLPHGSYLVNLGSYEPDKLARSRALLLEEMKRAAALGLRKVNVHPGSTRGKMSVDDCCKIIGESINYVHSKSATKNADNVSVIIENTAGQGNTIGRSFKELARIIEFVDDKSRVGLCIDTCHLFAAGGGDEGITDLRDATTGDWIGFPMSMERFEAYGLFKYLRGMHLNDSKVKFGELKDRHASLGEGHIGHSTFRFIMNDSRFDNIPLILETPTSAERVGREIREPDSDTAKQVSVSADYLKEINLLKAFQEMGNPQSSNQTNVKKTRKKAS